MQVLDNYLQKFAEDMPREIRYDPWATEEPLDLQNTPTPTVLSMQ